MKKLLMLTVCVMILGVAGNAFALIDWAGNVWPPDGHDIVPTSPVDVYAQVYKDLVTGEPGQGVGINGVLYYTTDVAAEVSVPMFFNTDVGSNDEYTGQIPQTALLGATYVSVRVVFNDETDGTDYVVTPVTYDIIPVLPVDVRVRFYLCMSGAETTGEPCVIGSAAEIGAWGSGVMMMAEPGTPELYFVEVTFLAGGNPSFEYKYKKDLCQTWEGTANRQVTLPTDGTSYVEFAADSWEFLPITCGMGNTLEEDKEICFQVCLEGVETIGGVCTVGGIPELDNWGAGVAADNIGLDLFQTCVTFPAGTAIPLNIEYKFKKDACDTWESVGNRLIVLDNSLATETTVSHSWDDGPSVCLPVAIEEASWGTIKGMYR